MTLMTEPIQTGFDFHSTTEQVIEGIDLRTKHAIVTGASSGIGFETAKALASAGAEVTLAVRRTDAGEVSADQIRVATGNANVHVRQLDVAVLSSIDAFVNAWKGPLDILINNAGIMALPTLERTREGFEMEFATNFVGHFALTCGLHLSLKSAGGARVVALSSIASMFAPVFFDDPHFNFIPYDPFLAYGQSKTAIILAAVELTRRWADDGIFANSLNPGAIARNLQKHTGGLKTPVERRKTPSQGAATSVLLATSPKLEGIGGRYFEDCNEAVILSHRPTDLRGGVAPYALDPANARRVWELGTKLTSHQSCLPHVSFDR